ncbi:MAG TPA: hypothetical protein DIU45_09250 [Clostridium sp.]|nr:hypothetical protein [Clostridium sp.]
MKAKCIDNGKNPALTINKDYIVYAGEFTLNDEIKEYTLFKIENDHGSIIPYNSKYFTISSNNNNDYINKKVEGNKYDFNYRSIAYWEFWSMLYDGAGNSIEDFRTAKQELYRSELNKEEILNRLNSDNIDERNLIVELLREDKNCEFIDEISRICKIQLDQWKNNNDLDVLFNYLSDFKNETVNQFFIDYLSENEKGNEILDKIVYKYSED